MNAELDSFAYSVSHDLRAPLRALQGYSRILIEDELDESERLAFARRINGAAQRMDLLVRDVLAFSRATRSTEEASSVDLSRAVGEALHQIEAVVAERLRGVEKYPESGLGLAIVRKGIEQTGGLIGLESALGSGSRFWIELRGGWPVSAVLTNTVYPRASSSRSLSEHYNRIRLGMARSDHGAVGYAGSIGKGQ